MACQHQLELSTFIKDVHKKLRQDAKSLGCERAWKEHCKDKSTLQKYATSMKQLSQDYWERNEAQNGSRNEWIYKQCKSYFKEGGLEYQRIREQRIAESDNLKVAIANKLENLDRYKLLDVGSCYNPLKKYNLFDITAVDIAPASDDVLRCDFLNLDITDEPSHITEGTITRLQAASFHIITFSLLLEYLPNSKQRLTCCETAYKLLIAEGLLVIITPDSKHVGANARLMKSWRYVLATLGFSRIRYEKLQYLHCMAFRKSANADVAKRWARLNEGKGLLDEIAIPQDFNQSGVT